MEAFEWDWGFFLANLPVLLDAGIITVVATITSFAIAIVLGLVIALGRDSATAAIRWPVASGSEFIRRTPVLVQIYFVYYVMPDLGLTLPALTAGILTLGLHYSTYVSEVYRSGIASVPRGQWDACAALGLRHLPTFRLVILPQALVPVVPALGNYLIILFKETPLLSAIAVVEMLQRAKIIGSLSFRYTEPITTVALIFLALSLVTAAGIRALERRLKRHLLEPTDTSSS